MKSTKTGESSSQARAKMGKAKRELRYQGRPRESDLST